MMLDLRSNELLFPQRVDHLRPTAPTRDDAGGLVEDYETVASGLRCKINKRSVKEASEMSIEGNLATEIIQFPDDAGALQGDIFMEVDANDARTGRGFHVERYDRIGLLNLARWQADCSARNTR